MPTQANVQQTILNGSYSLMKLVDNNLNLVMSGAEAIREGFIQWFQLNLQALTDQYNVSDYTSTTTVTLYDRINKFVGIPYGATIDPNFQNPGTVIDVVSPIPQPLTFTEANLVDNDPPNGQWYLPWTSAYTPVLVQVNGVTLPFQFNQNIANGPIGIYNFPNNSTQTIIVTIV